MKMSLSEPGPIGLAVMAVASVAIWSAVAIQTNHLNSQVAKTEAATVTDVQVTQIDRSTGTTCVPGLYGGPACSTDIDVRPASVVVTTTGRFLVEGTWRGLSGERVQLRTMRGGRLNLCRDDGGCEIVQQ